MTKTRRVILTSYVSDVLFIKINEWRGDESAAWVLKIALRDYIKNHRRSYAYEELAGENMIQAQISEEVKTAVQEFCEETGRSESWIAAKAIASFLRERGVV